MNSQKEKFSEAKGIIKNKYIKGYKSRTSRAKDYLVTWNRERRNSLRTQNKKKATFIH